MDRHIINCHIHTFTAEHVPANFLPFKLGSLLKVPYIRVPAQWIMGSLNPFDSRDKVNRYANFIKVAAGKSQRDILRIVLSRYPRGTRFVILPMDMAYMGAGKVPAALEQQHDELARLRDEFPEIVVPFAAVDPRRPGVVEMLKQLVEGRGFKGIKVYPNLGYAPNHPVLMQVWEYAEANSLPVMTHCSRGGPIQKGLSKLDLDRITAPSCWIPVLEQFPNLRICLAHLGGGEEWERYFEDGWHPDGDSKPKSWLADIVDLISSGKYPNLYSDISYTIFNFDQYAPVIKVFLSDSKLEALRSRILFGSDYYMIENERFEERLLSVRLRATLGEDLFWQIAHTNPLNYLG